MTVVMDSSMPYSQDLRWRVVRFAWSIGLRREEVAVYLGVSTWAVERSRSGDAKIKRSPFY